jgi:hypothetical protein
MADWDLTNLMLRRLDLHAAGANWQRSGKGRPPEPIPLPDAAGRGSSPAPSKPSGDELARRLRNLGLIPPGETD